MGRATFGQFGERTAPAAIGFARHMTPDRRPVASQPETYADEAAVQPWPGIAVGRKIDRPKAGKHVRSFVETLDAKAGKHGRATPLSRLMCRYVELDEMSGIMTELYPGPSRDMTNKRRNRLATEMRLTINTIIQDFAEAEYNDGLRTAGESVYLEQRMHKPDDYDLEMLDCHAVKVADRGFWQPASFDVDGPDGYGVFGVGLKLNDDSGDIRQARSLLVGKMRRKLGFDPSLIESDWYPQVQVLDTYPLPAPDMERFRLPSDTPYVLPFQKPHAYPET